MEAEPGVECPIFPIQRNIEPVRCILDIVDTLQDLCPSLGVTW